VIIALEMLAVQHFFTDYAGIVEITRNILFALGWITLLGSELVHFFKVKKEVDKITVNK